MSLEASSPNIVLLRVRASICELGGGDGGGRGHKYSVHKKIHSLIFFHNNFCSRYYFTHFTDEKTEAWIK